MVVYADIGDDLYAKKAAKIVRVRVGVRGALLVGFCGGPLSMK